MAFHDVLDDGKAKPGARRMPVPLHGTVEDVEHPAALRLGDAGPLVGHGQRHARGDRLGHDADGAALGGVFRGILKQVDKGLADQHRVGRAVGRIGLGDEELEVPGAGPRQPG